MNFQEYYLNEEKYDPIDFVPPKEVAKRAEIGLKYRRLSGGKGGLNAKQASKEGIGSGVQRAINLKNRDKLSPETVKRMKSFFDRHDGNEKINDKSKPDYMDKGKVAFELWGGEAGKRWVNKIVNQMNNIDME